MTGLLVLHPSHLGAGVAAQMEAQKPLQVLPAPDVHVAILNWGDLRRVVAPRPDKRFLVPSPFPYLPSTGAELLESYLAVVGVRPSDCYSAQVTLDQPTNILGGSAHFMTTSAESEIAADGESRKRFRGGSRVVVAYRDSPDYAAGRERWAAYERDVLQASLSHRDRRPRAPRQAERPRSRRPRQAGPRRRARSTPSSRATTNRSGTCRTTATAGRRCQSPLVEVPRRW